jgi:polyphosphate kinase 2 (PPK2 family)
VRKRRFEIKVSRFQEKVTYADYRKRMIVKPGQKLDLKDVDPAFKGRHETREAAAQELERYRQKLGQLQALLYAEKKHSVLIVLQALDAGGKDGTVNHVFAAFNPQGTIGGQLQTADPDRARSRFSLAGPPACPAKGMGGDLQPLPLRGRIDCQGPQTGGQAHMDRAL